MPSAPNGMKWHEDLSSLVGDAGMRYGAGVAPAEEEEDRGMGVLGRSVFGRGFYGPYEEGSRMRAEESFKEKMMGFVMASGEMLQELGPGCWDIAQQSLEDFEETYVGKQVRGHWDAVSRRLEFLNEYLPEDRDPAQAWPIVIAVFLVALLVLNVNRGIENPIEPPKKLYLSPPSASRVQLPDGIPGIKESLLEEFGVRLVTYDLPGFGESDPHPGRDLNSSAMDMLHLSNALGVADKFWVVGYSSGAMHAWAAAHYIPDRIAGGAMFAPMVNPYDPSLNKEESRKIRDKWTMERKMMYFLARRLPSLLPYFYHRSFLSGKHGQPEKWLSLALGKKDKSLLEEPSFREFWEKDVAEAARQGDAKPFKEEAVLQVSNWGFSLADIQVQKRPHCDGLLSRLKSLYSEVEKERAGFLGPIHLWQGMDDHAVPPLSTKFIRRLVPRAIVHRMLDEGHFSYFCFCDNCHRQILFTLLGDPQGPLTNELEEIDESVTEAYIKETT